MTSYWCHRDSHRLYNLCRSHPIYVRYKVTELNWGVGSEHGKSSSRQNENIWLHQQTEIHYWIITSHVALFVGLDFLYFKAHLIMFYIFKDIVFVSLEQISVSIWKQRAASKGQRQRSKLNYKCLCVPRKTVRCGWKQSWIQIYINKVELKSLKRLSFEVFHVRDF